MLRSGTTNLKGHDPVILRLHTIAPLGVARAAELVAAVAEGQPAVDRKAGR